MVACRFLILLVLCGLPAKVCAAPMTDTSISFSSSDPNKNLEIAIEFRPSSHQLSPGDKVYLHLPRFTRSTYVRGKVGGSAGSDLAAGSLELRPSIFWAGQWTEGTFCGNCPVPFAESVVTLELKSLEPIVPDSTHTVFIELSNGIKAFCGNGANSSDFLIGTDASGSIVTQTVETSPSMGAGCHGNCSSHGQCDYCYGFCRCDEGYGSPRDVTDVFIADCSQRTCPGGRAPAVPLSSNKAHRWAECSDHGRCDRAVGECHCFPPWDGAACDRRRCPNDCSGHGQCASMAQQGYMADALPLTVSTPAVVQYGSTEIARDTVAWDYDAMRGCVCDSDWPVGLGPGEVQEPQWFTPDCSLRRCPSGDNPDTEANETDCSGKLAPGGHAYGEPGNVCYVECSNRGICEYDRLGVGSCKCFYGYFGDNCGIRGEFVGKSGI